MFLCLSLSIQVCPEKGITPTFLFYRWDWLEPENSYSGYSGEGSGFLGNINQVAYGCGSKCKVWIKPRSHTRSRPPIQTFRKDLIQTFDPDLWNDIIFWWVYVWSSDGVMFLGFLLCSYSPCQAAKQQTVVKPRCRAVGLPSCKATLLSSPAAKLQLLCIQAVKLPSWHCCKL